MPGVYPIPTGRATDALLHARLLAQLSFDQRNLLLTQEQISTGRAFSRPSDSPAKAIRGLELQRTLEIKQQYSVNITTSESFLSAADSAATGGLSTIREVRASILTAISTTTSATQRDSLITDIQGAIGFLADLGNTTFRGRQLFGGTENEQPVYQVVANNLITYNGNAQALSTFIDRGYQVPTNVIGNDLFGGLSASVTSSTVLAPAVTESTRLADLFNGQGIPSGSIRISDGTRQADINLNGIKTVGDLIGRLRRGAPSGRTLDVQVIGNQLQIGWDDDLGGTLRIEDLSGGNVAKSLGIEQLSPSFSGTIDSGNLAPRTRVTTNLADLLGTRARAHISSDGEHNDIQIQARSNGSNANDFHFQLVDDNLLSSGPGVDSGSEFVNFSSSAVAARASVALSGTNNDLLLTANTAGTDFNHVSIRLVNGGAMGNNAVATYDASAKRLDLVVDGSGGTQIQTLINAINSQGTFSAAYDPTMLADGGFIPSASVSPLDLGQEVGNTSQSGGEANTFFVHVNAIGSTGANVVAALNANATFASQFQASLDPFDGGPRSNQGTGRLSFDSIGQSQGGSGESLDLSSGMQLRLGTETYTVRFEGAKTVEDLLNKLRFSGAPILAQLDDSGRLQVRSRLSGVDFSISENGGTTASQLGLRSFSEATEISQLNYGQGIQTREGTDFVIRRNDGIEISIDVSSARTIGDVLDLINDHPSNQDAGRVLARLATVGNGIELIDDDPVGDQSLTVISSFGSRAAEGLGLVARGATEGFANESAAPTRASLDVEFSFTPNANTAFRVEANKPGSDFNGVDVILVDGGAVGNSASAVFDKLAGTLTITIDPSATTAVKVVQAIESEGTFKASLSTSDGPNNGAGIISATGSVGITAGGSSTPEAQVAELRLQFPSPANTNTALHISAETGGTAWNGVEVIFNSSLVGNVATASYDSALKQLVVNLDPSATTSSTIAAAINAEGTFAAILDTEADPTNDGSGVPAATLSQGVLSGGTSEALIGHDVNPQTTAGVFDTLSRLIRALEGSSPDLNELERLGQRLDEDLNRINFSIADIGARSRALEVVRTRVEDETLQLTATLSEEIDADLVESISNLTAQQATYEASLRLIAQSFQLSLLEFL